MKKLLLFASVIAAGPLLTAQTVLFEDDFESYTVGEGIAAQASDVGWQLWTAGQPQMDAMVSDMQASSGTNSIHLLQSAGVDIVYDVGTPLITGKYDIEFKMYIPAGKEGYFNVMHNWDLNSTNNYEWAADVYFSANGQVTWTTGFTDGGAVAFDHDTWFDMKVAVDMDADLAKIYYNGEELVAWQWSLNNADGMPGLNQFKVVNFFAYGPSQTNGDYYIDDFKISDTSDVSVTENERAELTVFPNPAVDNVNIDLSGFSNPTVSIYSIDGRVIDRFQTTSEARTLYNVANFSKGIYFVEVLSGSQKATKRLVIR